MTVWFSSDFHLGHDNIIGFADRPFRDVDHMNIEIMRRWTECVMPDDEIWLLGDMAMGDRDKTLPMIGSLPGRKHLIVGNHDSCFGGRGSVEKIARETERHLAVFETVEPSASIEVLGRPVRLCHFPYTGESKPGREDRWTGNRLDDDGGWLLCGHVHTAWKVKDRQVNVGVDNFDFYPVSDEEIVAIMDEAEDAE